jgi:hypothetical protein
VSCIKARAPHGYKRRLDRGMPRGSKILWEEGENLVYKTPQGHTCWRGVDGMMAAFAIMNGETPVFYAHGEVVDGELTVDASRILP